MSFSASCSASFGSSSLILVSGVAMSVDLQFHVAVLDPGLEGLHRDVGGKSLRPSAPQVEQRSVTRALHGTRRRVELALGERAVVVRAAILDRVQLTVGGMKDADLAPVLGLHDPHRALGELLEPADG